MKLFDNITIIGVGLIGGSLARACKQRGLVETITGFGRNRANLEKAVSLKFINRYSTDIKEAVKDADLVVLCSPVGTLVPRVREMLPALKEGCIVTDAGSVKTSVVREIDALMPGSVLYVGAHPIAGGERSGIKASAPNLFDGAACIVTPTEKTDQEALKKVLKFWEAVGMRTHTMDTEEHDYIFGAVSHLPHIVAYALMNTIGELKTNNQQPITLFSGGGLKDITRIASGDPVMWRDIFLANKQPTIELLGQFRDTLDQLKVWIEKEDGESLKQAFTEANKYRFNLV
ncbi:MAG: prephenate dehydrogenase/arogenate dehydrogenase family protein [Nitrospinaceae bacterium]